jgi:hypothetical protein
MIESDSEEMFEHPEALKLALISQFYQNASNYDLRRILKLIIQMEHDLEVDGIDSIQQIKPTVPYKKFSVLILGD